MDYKVIIVDDEPLFRRSIQKIIEESITGYRVVYTAADGLDCLEYLKNNTADMIITDIKMPRMDGIQLLERLKAAHSGIIAAVLSAYDEYPLIREAFKLGASDYLLKTDINCQNLQSLLAALTNQLLLNQNSALQEQRSSAVQGGTSSKAIYSSMRQQLNEWIHGSPKSGTDIIAALASMGRRLTEDLFACAVIEADNFKQVAHLEWQDNQEILHFACMNILEEKLMVPGKSAVLPYAYDTFVLIFAHETEKPPLPGQAISRWNELKEIMEAVLHLHISYGVSGAQRSLESLRTLIEYARRALETGCPYSGESSGFFPPPPQMKLAGFPKGSVKYWSPQTRRRYCRRFRSCCPRQFSCLSNCSQR